jgi:hypothetical protein
LQPLPLNRRSTSAWLANTPPMHYYGGRSNTRRAQIHCIHWSTRHIKTTSSMGTLTITSLIRIFSSRF